MGNTIQLRGGNIHLVSGSTKTPIVDASGSATFPSLTGSEYMGSFQLDPNDPTSLYISGSGVGNLMYMSGSGKVGFGTTNPKTNFDIKADTFKVRSSDGRRELEFTNDGRLATKKYANQEVSESKGGEILLTYTPGTFENPKKAQIGETIGTISWVDESYNIINKYDSSGSVAQITSTIKTATEEGVTGDIQFKINVDPGDPKAPMVSMMNISAQAYPPITMKYGLQTDDYIRAKALRVGSSLIDPGNGNVYIEGNATILGSLTTDRLTTNTLVTNVVSSSILFTSGSNIIGDEQSDIHQFTGSVSITGSLEATSINGGSF
tara:strand:+ start:252 stop:1214 length:963 start_codon:yes stop_codon:yes gene_type:complete